MDQTERLRAFVALPLPEILKAALAGLLPALRRDAPAKLAFVRPETWHLTLKFLGDVPLAVPLAGPLAGPVAGPLADPVACPVGVPALAAALSAALSAVDVVPFDLTPGGGVFFPNADRPRVVAVGLAAGARACRELAAGVDIALAALGFPRQTRPFTPHLTVARIKSAPGRGDWRGVAGHLARAVWPTCRMDRFVLYKSLLGPGGARHEVLCEFPARRDGPA